MSGNDFVDIAEFIEDAQTFAVCGHVNPDGDCIGSVLGMTAALRQAGKKVTPLLADTSMAPARYMFLHGYGDFVRASDYIETPDVLIQVDTATVDRMGEAEALLGRCAKSVSIDHHPGEGLPTDMQHQNWGSASASMLVWDLARAIVGEPDVFTAMACYTGLLTDTGRFQFQNTDGAALTYASEMVEAGADPALVATEVFQTRPLEAIQLEGRLIQRIKTTPAGMVAYSWVANNDYAELGAHKEDTEGLIDTVRAVNGIEVALLIRARENDVRCSIRAKREYDVSTIARQFNGGGHKAAAGFTLEGTLEQNRAKLQDLALQIEQQILAENSEKDF